MIDAANTDAANALANISASISQGVSATEDLHAKGIYSVTHQRPAPEDLERYISLRDRLASYKAGMARIALIVVADMQAELDAIRLHTVGVYPAPNLVTTVGGNAMLDSYLAGSGYTAALYLGLIALTSYTGVAAGDTMASHAGWLEAGGANAPAYSQGTRPATAWSAAAARTKALSSALTFSITSPGTVKGCFITTVATKDGTTGTLFSAGLFTGGDKALSNGDTLSVSYSASV